uniref:Uncharacterized protein n=1 Tax=Oryzias latipes TaxID=8090 RepID=A0A3P9I3Q5_ORYLA
GGFKGRGQVSPGVMVHPVNLASRHLSSAPLLHLQSPASKPLFRLGIRGDNPTEGEGRSIMIDA